ncbi:YfiT family bacillithiol transferase [Paenibacillus sp. N3.4]|uniref:YfiT family bacillithiol transferase n=1 Tax=Paenibacillus sp. N3.4 TaxID=2603222 RepID=UPI0011CBE6CD|nr:bacillithiol transferase BstA [Paenibacillus sp. N3.4]TXK74086.1 putative metal-dependent hydrolase [Paenibacillus sp. N3.4]
MIDLRYPIGPFAYEGDLTSEVIAGWIQDIEAAPAQLKEAVKNLSDDQLDTAYRPGGWTLRQVVHHLADSHINSYTRFKLALTEDNPTIKPYMEEKWAELPDSRLPVDISLSLLASLHGRWVVLLRSLQPSDLEKTFIHPDSGIVTLGLNIGIYAWHGRHHIAHITSLRDHLGWS